MYEYVLDCWIPFRKEILSLTFGSFIVQPKGQLISKCPFGVIVWTKLATKKFDNFCPGGQIKKIKALYYSNKELFNIIGIIKFRFNFF